MLRIKAHRLLAYTTQELWDGLEGTFILEFPDGDLVTNARECIYSSYVWDYHRKYPATQLTTAHHIQVINGMKAETSANAHLKLCNQVYWDVYDEYVNRVSDQRDLIDDLNKQGYEISNKLYNELSYRCEAWVTSLDIVDFVQIVKSPVIAKALEETLPSEQGIECVSKLIQDQLNQDPEFAMSPLAIAIRTGIARMGQAMQCLGPRGFLTDVDSEIFKSPILSSYISGIRSLYDSMIERCSSAKALMNSTTPLQSSEYFSRRQQLICQNVRNLHLGDCGSTSYLLWEVRDVRYEGTTRVSNGDLPTLDGKWYMDDDGVLKVIRKHHRSLIGRTLRLRDPVAGCAHSDPYGICSTCYGEAGLAIPKRSNLGHVACVTMTSVLGQLILSTKHFDGSSVVEGIVLKSHEKHYLSAELNGNRYFLNEKLKSDGKVVKLLLRSDDVTGLPVLKLVNDIYECNISRLSEFDTVGIEVGTMRGGELRTETTSLSVRVNARKSSLSHDFLKHIKEHGYRVLSDSSTGGKGGGKHEFDMTGWDYSKPVFVLPMIHFNMGDHQAGIAAMLESTATELEKRSGSVSPAALLTEFYDLVNRRLQVNLSVLSTILYSSMAISAIDNDYALPKVGTSSGLGVMRMLLRNRSMSAQLGFQGHRNTLIDPTSYTNTNRLDHIFDVAFMPHEVLGNNPHFQP